MLDDKKILLVEDDPLILRLYTKSLRRAGAEVVLAANGDEGLEKIKDESIDLVLLDLDMPDMDGFEMLERMRGDRHTKDVPVMIITNQRSSSEDMVRLGKLGIKEYIEKSSMPLPELVDEIKRYFDTSQ